MNPSCSIIIRTFNEGRYLGELINGIKHQDYPQSLVEILIVDSGSSDSTLEIARKHGCRIVQISREEFSFGRSLNRGCVAALGEFLVFVSGHCVPVNDRWLWELLKPFHQPEVAITYGRQQGGPESKFSEHALFSKYFPPHATNGQSGFFCNNANLALRRACWEKVNFDESLTGLEDMHLAKQLFQQGWKVAYVPTAAVFHYHHEKWGQVKRRYEREAIALREIMPEIHVHWHDAARYFIAGVMGDFASALQQKVLWRRAAEIIFFRFCQYYGAWRGNHTHRALSRSQKDRYFYPH